MVVHPVVVEVFQSRPARWATSHAASVDKNHSVSLQNSCCTSLKADQQINDYSVRGSKGAFLPELTKRWVHSQLALLCISIQPRQNLIKSFSIFDTAWKSKRDHVCQCKFYTGWTAPPPPPPLLLVCAPSIYPLTYTPRWQYDFGSNVFLLLFLWCPAASLHRCVESLEGFGEPHLPL